jgi:hypothetical protein
MYLNFINLQRDPLEVLETLSLFPCKLHKENKKLQVLFFIIFGIETIITHKFIVGKCKAK